MEFTKVKFMVVWLDNNLGYTENNNNPKKNKKQVHYGADELNQNITPCTLSNRTRKK